MPYDEEAAVFAAEMYELYEQGVDEYADEIRQQGVAPEVPGEDGGGGDGRTSWRWR